MFTILCIVSRMIWLWKETFIFALASATIFVPYTHQIEPLDIALDLFILIPVSYYLFYILHSTDLFRKVSNFQKLIQPYTIMSSVIKIWNIWISTNNVLWISWQSGVFLWLQFVCYSRLLLLCCSLGQLIASVATTKF